MPVAGQRNRAASRRARPAAPRRGARIEPVRLLPRAPPIVRCLPDPVIDPGLIATPVIAVRGDPPASDLERPGRAAGRGSLPQSPVDGPIDAATGARRTARTTRHPGPLATRIDRDIQVAGGELARSSNPIDLAERPTGVSRRPSAPRRPAGPATRPATISRWPTAIPRWPAGASRRTTAGSRLYPSRPWPGAGPTALASRPSGRPTGRSTVARHRPGLPALVSACRVAPRAGSARSR
jgi:hypothetical protein